MTSNLSSRAGYRKTRIVCVSDTHNQTPKLPSGDVLIHAGDLTNQGSLPELQRTVAWLEKADFEIKIVVAGNHDVTLDTPFYEEHGSYFHNQQLQDLEACQALLKSSPSITYLQHESRELYLNKPTGPQTVFTVFGSPYSPAQGTWAFQYDAARAATIWDAIPLNADIVVTHAPPHSHCDYSASNRSKGCEALRKALWRVRPMLSVCGHTHEGRGSERVRWKLDLPLCPYLEEKTKFWTDPGTGTKKLSHVDLTEKGGKPLDNIHDSSVQQQAPSLSSNRVSFSPPPSDTSPAPQPRRRCRLRSRQRSRQGSKSRSRSRSKSVTREGPAATECTSNMDEKDITELEEWYSRLDGLNVSALAGRLGRKETCIVNAAITGTSWGQGPKKFNKPIVVDLELPVWEGASIPRATVPSRSAQRSMDDDDGDL